MLCFGNRPFWRASGSMIVRILFTIRSLAYLADRLCRAGRRAARAVPGLGMAAVALTNTGMGFAVTVLRPLAPIVVKSGILCGKRIGVVGAYFTTRTGQIIHCVMGAVRRRFQRFWLLHLLCVCMHMDQCPMRIERLCTNRQNRIPHSWEPEVYHSVRRYSQT